MSASKVAERALLGTAALILAAIAACGGSEASEADGDGAAGAPYVCVPGITKVCIGPGACEGAEICLPDGSGFGPCDCGGASGGTTGTGGSSSSGGSGVGGASGSAQGGVSGTSPTGGSGGIDLRVQKLCLKGCSAATDCGTGTPADSPANYICVDGACQQSGCLSDAECDAQAAGTVCRPYPGLNHRICNRGCTSVATCGDQTGVSQLYGTDNYTCNGDGVCQYIGCHTDAECQTDLQKPSSHCVNAIPYPNCVDACQTPADCTVPLAAPPTAAANYRCDSGSCVWIGCLNDAECSFVPGYVCRPFMY